MYLYMYVYVYNLHTEKILYSVTPPWSYYCGVSGRGIPSWWGQSLPLYKQELVVGKSAWFVLNLRKARSRKNLQTPSQGNQPGIAPHIANVQLGNQHCWNKNPTAILVQLCRLT